MPSKSQDAGEGDACASDGQYASNQFWGGDRQANWHKVGTQCHQAGKDHHKCQGWDSKFE